jgi:DivIVA domain-containing protein
MALTPEDVVNKRFNPTKFREGYDQDEVDDFLDEVVVELRRLNQENEELRQRLVSADSRMAELQRSASQAPAAQAPAAAPVAAPVPEQQPAFAQGNFDSNAMDPGNTNNLLQLARRLHEEHVREGMEKRDALISEGHATAARVVSEAEQSARAQLDTLQQEARAQVDTLQQERQELERRVEELRGFEREYRAKLRGYIEGQLRELESSNALTAAPAQAAVAAAPQSGPQPTYAPTAAPAQYGQPQQQQDYAAYPSDYPGFGPAN